MPVPIVSPSTISAEAQRRGQGLLARVISSKLFSWNRWTCIVNFRCENTHGTLPNSPAYVKSKTGLAASSPESNRPVTNFRALCFLDAVVDLLESGRMSLGNSHMPASRPKYAQYSSSRRYFGFQALTLGWSFLQQVHAITLPPDCTH